MINFEILNRAIGNVTSDEFAALYLLANTMSLKKEKRVRLYREMMADKLGWFDENRPQYGLKKVTKVTNALVEKGYLNKDIIFENPKKSVTYYSLNLQKLDDKIEASMQKSVPLNNNKKEIIEEIKYNNDLDENPADGFSPRHNEEYDALLEQFEGKGKTCYEVYSAFAQKGQEAFNWFCYNYNLNNQESYNGSLNARIRAASKYKLTIPTIS